MHLDSIIAVSIFLVESASIDHMVVTQLGRRELNV